MPVDASIYANAVPQPINPLATLGQVATTQSAMNQNKLFGQEFAARKAVGQAYSNALDPATGQVDVNKLVAGVASNPDAAFKAGEVGANALQQQQGQTALDTARVALARTHFANLASGFGSLAATPDLTVKHFTDLATDYVAQGMITPQTAATELAQLPANATPQQLQQAAKAFQLRALDGAAQIDKMYGTPQVINNGQGQQVVAASPLMGTTTAISPVIPNALSPGEKAARVGVFANGQPGTTNQGSLVDDYGNAAPAGGALGNGRYPTAAPAGAQGPAGASPTGFVASGPPLGASTAADVNAGGSAKSLQDLHDSVANSGTRLYQLQTGLQALQGATTGKGSQTPQDIASFIQTIAPETAKAIGIDPNKIANYDEATKYLTGYAQNQAGNFGSHTDSQLATALTANPSTHISNLAATDVVKANIGLERMKQAQAQAFDESGLPPEQFNKWQVQWNKNVDPRAYMVDQLTSDKYRAMVSSMKPAEKQAFYQNLNSAIQSGFVTVPGQPNAQ